MNLWRNLPVFIKYERAIAWSLLEIQIWGKWVCQWPDFYINTFFFVSFHRPSSDPTFLLSSPPSLWSSWSSPSSKSLRLVAGLLRKSHEALKGRQPIELRKARLWRWTASSLLRRPTPMLKPCLRPTSLPPWKSNLSPSRERPHQVVTQDRFWMLLLDSSLIPILHEHSEEPNAGVSCIFFSGFLNISFLGHSLLFRRDQVNLPSLQEGLATWHLTTWPALPPLSSNMVSWGQIGEWE